MRTSAQSDKAPVHIARACIAHANCCPQSRALITIQNQILKRIREGEENMAGQTGSSNGGNRPGGPSKSSGPNRGGSGGGRSTDFAAPRPPTRGPNARGKKSSDRGRPVREQEPPAAVIAKLEPKPAKEAKRVITQVEVGDFITVRDLAGLMERSPIDLIKILMQYGIMAPITHNIDHDTAVILGEELGVAVLRPDQISADVEADDDDDEAREVDLSQTRVKQILGSEKEKNLVDRPPVVAVLGHVDHGKTTLLDRIRHTDVASGEAGGITQRTGAYQVTLDGKLITFLDTPGHEAFTAMRSRGARVTDIVVLVVAADDGVMPQTREAISHAKAAGVQIIVAVNKVDKANANPDRVIEELAKEGLQAEQWGGETIVVPLSALRNEGIDDLLANILVVAELENYRANPNGKLVGTVIESSLDKHRGVTATLLVQNGTLHQGDSVVVGSTWGKIKAMFDHEGKSIKVAGPSTPVIVLGLQESPEAGDVLEGVRNDKEAKVIAEERRLDDKSRAGAAAAAQPRMSLEELFDRVQGGGNKVLNLIVRADLQGTLEPVINSLNDTANDEIDIKILHAAVGNISESDVMLAEASDAIIIGFSVGTDKAAAARAELSGVEIRNYTIIYKMIEDIEDAVKGMLDPVYEERTVGHATVLQLFKLRRGSIAGCTVLDGTIKRNAMARVLRNGTPVIFPNRVETLRRFTEDVNEVRTGFECGIKLQDRSDDVQIGDVIETYENVRVR
jgi:translation initiation factor IF-2